MNRIQKLFTEKQSNILSVFYTAGFPNLKDTGTIAQHLELAGADIIEIGIPYSDPIADGPVIQASNKTALDNGMTLVKLLQQVRELRSSINVPLILMGYLNPILQYGVEKFCKDAASAGVDGVILPDMPMDEYQTEYKSIVESHGLSNTFLIAPTTSEKRIRQIDDATNGFIYAVSSSSTTGAQGGFDLEQENYFKKLKALKLKNPFLIGFGVSNNQTFSKACEFASGAIVGSAFISLLKDSKDFKADIQDFVNRLRNPKS
ncbi:MAG: tryptophan synthase subunit alpha [Bacteroidia bacterium]|nr:tryptophan synthase subunit alpha [Bacteroidia bacterium]